MNQIDERTYTMSSQTSFAEINECISKDFQDNYFKDQLFIVVTDNFNIDEVEQASSIAFNYEGKYAELIYKTQSMSKYLSLMDCGNVTPIIQLHTEDGNYNLEIIANLLANEQAGFSDLTVEYIVNSKIELDKAISALRFISCMHFEHNVNQLICVSEDSDVLVTCVLENMFSFAASLECLNFLDCKYLGEISQVINLFDLGVANPPSDRLGEEIWNHKDALLPFISDAKKSFVRSAMKDF